MNCIGCKFSQFPNCAIQSIITATPLEDIISGKRVKNVMYPVCHKNAQRIDNGTMIVGDTCDNCMLCEVLCVNHEGIVSCTGALEKTIFSDLNRFNMYLKQRLGHCIIGTEIKAKGNAREKRIDIVVKKDRTIYLVKTLSDIDKTPYYSRSYMDLVNYYTEHCNGYTFRKIILIPQKRVEAAQSMGYECCTVDALVAEISEG